MVAKAQGSLLTLDFEVGPDPDPSAFELNVFVELVPPPEQRHELEPVTVPPGAFLIGAYGVDPEARGVGTAPIALRVLAVADDVPTLAERLAAQGYQTAAITEDAMLSASTGITRGFASYREIKSGIATEGYVREVVDEALAWLERRRGERFFLFLHTYQVHGPYAPPPEYDVFRTWARDGREVEVDESTPEVVRARLRYAGEVLYTDAQIGRLLAGLEALGEAERTIVIVTADHGEALGEHGVIGHNWYLIEPVLRVPLIVRAPGRTAPGTRIAAPASLADVTPTILELAGIEIPRAVQGQSLVPLLERPGDERFLERVVYAERDTEDGSRPTVVARKGRFKWVDAGARGMSRWDLVADPGELHPTRDPEALAEGEALLARYRTANEQLRAELGIEHAPAAPVDEATMNKLRALGYVR